MRRGEDVSPECLLLALVSESEGNAVLILSRLGAPLDRLVSMIPDPLHRRTPPRGEVELTREVKRAMDFAFEEVRRQKSGYFGTEHLLLGLIREGSSPAARVLVDLGADPEIICSAIEAGLLAESSER